MIETRVLQQFIVVAERLNFHRAAEQLHMSQPPLSVAMRQLEEKTGVTLFIRHRSGVTLTPAGEAFLPSARAVLQALNAGITHAQHIAQGMAGKLTLSSVSLAGYPVLLTALRRFRQAYPQVEMIIKEMPTASQVAAVQQGEVDLAFVRQPTNLHQDVKLTRFISEPVLAALPADHALATQSEIDLMSLAREDFVFTPQFLGEGYHQQLISFCQQAGFYPRIMQEAAQISTLIALVSCGFGVTLVPESVANATANHKVRFLPLKTSSEPPVVELYMLQAASQGDSPQLAHFQALLHQAEMAVSCR